MSNRASDRVRVPLELEISVPIPPEHYEAAVFHIVGVLAYFSGQTNEWHVPPGAAVDTDGIIGGDVRTLADTEEAAIRFALAQMRPTASFSEIANVLGISKKTLYEKRKQYGLID
jgi:DNA-binding NtrC family response regulator